MINRIIATLITVGGTGYINYLVASQLNAIEPIGDKKTSQIAYCMIWSIVDFSTFLFYQGILIKYVHGNWLLIWSMLLTIITAFFLALLLVKPLQKISYFLYNCTLWIWGESTIDQGSVWQDFFNGRGELETYCYDLQHNPVGQGFLTTYSLEDDKYDISLQPFTGECKQPSFDEIIKWAQNEENRKKQKIREYINYDKQIVIFTFE